jgi:hypothetical protein
MPNKLQRKNSNSNRHNQELPETASIQTKPCFRKQSGGSGTNYTKALCIARFDFAEPITPDKSSGLNGSRLWSMPVTLNSLAHYALRVAASSVSNVHGGINGNFGGA